MCWKRYSEPCGLWLSNSHSLFYQLLLWKVYYQCHLLKLGFDYLESTYRSSNDLYLQFWDKMWWHFMRRDSRHQRWDKMKNLRVKVHLIYPRGLQTVTHGPNLACNLHMVCPLRMFIILSNGWNNKYWIFQDKQKLHVLSITPFML